MEVTEPPLTFCPASLMSMILVYPLRMINNFLMFGCPVRLTSVQVGKRTSWSFGTYASRFC